MWDSAPFKNLTKIYPILETNLVGVLSGYALELEQRFREVATEKVPVRIARQLLRLLESIGQPVNGIVEIAISRRQLSQMTGASPYTVSRLLAAREKRGIVASRREAVAITNIQSLKSLAGHIQPYPAKERNERLDRRIGE